MEAFSGGKMKYQVGDLFIDLSQRNFIVIDIYEPDGFDPNTYYRVWVSPDEVEDVYTENSLNELVAENQFLYYSG